MKCETLGWQIKLHTRTNWKYNLINIHKLYKKKTSFPPVILASLSDAFLSYHLSVVVYNYWKKMLNISTITENKLRNFQQGKMYSQFHSDSDSVSDKLFTVSQWQFYSNA